MRLGSDIIENRKSYMLVYQGKLLVSLEQGRTYIPQKWYRARKEKIIAIYHCSIKIISRGKGKSAVGAAAYRSGEKLTNDYDGITHDFTRKGGVVHKEILLSDNAPREFFDRETLWNAVEKVEKSKNSQLAREIEISLPNELSLEKNIALAKEFVQKTFVNKGMCVDFCIHDPNREQPNVHAHIMLTMRPINADGTWGDKQKKEYILDADGNKIYDKRKRTYKCKTVQTTDWNSKEKAEEWRAEWADFLNNTLAENNISECVDHRSFERQGKQELPTIHMGVSATQMERKGIRTVKGDINRDIQASNRRLREIDRAIAKTEKLIAELSKQSKEENIVAKLVRFHDNGIKFAEVRGLKLSNLKSAEKLKDMSAAIAYLQGHGISKMSEIEEHLAVVTADYNALKGSIISQNSRRKELSELLGNYENYKPNKAVFQEYESISNPKKREKFYNAHSSEIEVFKAARNFFKNTLGDGKITPKAWKMELSEIENYLEADRHKLSKLEDEIAILSTVAYNMKSLDNYENRTREFQRKKNMGLE